MSKKDPIADDLNANANIPKPRVGLSRPTSGGSVKTDWKNIRWTRKKLIIAAVLLGFPYGIAIAVTVAAKVYLISFILIGLGIMVFLLYQLIRWIDTNDRF